MPIAEFFRHIRRKDCPALPEGRTENIGDFFEACVRHTLPNRARIAAWDELLNRYVDDREAVFFVRRNAAGDDGNGGWNNRRGFLTRHTDGFQYVFVDNSFSIFFYCMAYNDYTPRYDDFKEYVLNRQLRCGSFACSREKLHRAYKTGSAPLINSRGWKLSHVFSANEDYNFDYQGTVNRLFPPGEYEDFISRNGSDYPYRSLNRNLTDDDKDIVKAHFLRVVHPINYFLSPQYKRDSRCHIFTEGTDIGEYGPLLLYCRKYLQETYGDLFVRYQNRIKTNLPIVTETLENLGAAEAHVQYGFGVGRVANPNVVQNVAGPREQAPRVVTPRGVAPAIDLVPNNINQFKAALLRTHTAQRTWFFANGTSRTEIWNARNFNEHSDVMANIRTNSLFKKWRENGIVRVRVVVDE